MSQIFILSFSAISSGPVTKEVKLTNELTIIVVLERWDKEHLCVKNDEHDAIQLIEMSGIYAMQDDLVIVWNSIFTARDKFSWCGFMAGNGAS